MTVSGQFCFCWVAIPSACNSHCNGSHPRGPSVFGSGPCKSLSKVCPYSGSLLRLLLLPAFLWLVNQSSLQTARGRILEIFIPQKLLQAGIHLRVSTRYRVQVSRVSIAQQSKWCLDGSDHFCWKLQFLCFFQHVQYTSRFTASNQRFWSRLAALSVQWAAIRRILLTAGSRSGHFSHCDPGTLNFSAVDSLSEFYNPALKGYFDKCASKLRHWDKPWRSLVRGKSQKTPQGYLILLTVPFRNSFSLFVRMRAQSQPISRCFASRLTSYCHCVWPRSHKYP